MILRKWWALCALFIVPALSDCATLEPFTSLTCGNGVIDEATEDCDTFPRQAEGKRLCGAAGAAGQCRLLCNQPDLECPPGWGCSVDGFCRQPKGAEFERAEEPVSVGVSSLIVGDFDGDGRKDIFGTSALVATAGKGRFHYFGADGKLAQTVALPANITSPFALDLDGDGKDDLGFGYNFRFLSAIGGGIAVVQGQADRAIATKLFPSFQFDEFEGVLVRVPGELPTTSDPRAPYLAVGRGRSPTTKLEGNVILSADVDAAGNAKYNAPLPLAWKHQVGDPISAPLFRDDKTSTCGEVVVAFQKGPDDKDKDGPKRAISVYSPCTPAAVGTRWYPERPALPIDLSAVPADAPVTGIHLADENGDGLLDVLIGVDPPANAGPAAANVAPRVYVARNDGKTLGAAVALGRIELPNLPLASGDINGDGMLDYVLPGVMLVSLSRPPGSQGPFGGPDAGDDGGDAGDGGAPPKLTRYPIRVTSKLWTAAIIADVNADGIPDVVGASADAPDLDVVQGRLGDAADNMTAFSIATTGTVSKLASKDVDGDQTNDVIIVQRRATSDKLDWEIAVAYGRPTSMPPEAPRVVGRTRGFKQIFGDDFGVGIVTNTPQENKPLPLFALAFLLGTGERQPFAPILLQDENSLATAVDRRKTLFERNWLPRTVAPGAFAMKGRIDIGAVAQGTPGDDYNPDAYGVWLTAAGRKDLLEFAPPRETIQLLELERARPADITLQMKVKDITGDGVDEVVTVTPDAPLRDGTSQVALRILYPSRKGADVEKKILVTGRAITSQGRLELVDFDKDGKVDLIAILLERDSLGNFVRRVNVFLGDGAGGFSSTPISIVLGPDSAVENERTALDAVGVTTLTTRAASRDGNASEIVTELIVLSRRRLFRMNLSKDAKPIEITDVFRGSTKLDDASDIVAGDFDGDGVDDLAVAAGGAIRIVRQLPRLR